MTAKPRIYIQRSQDTVLGHQHRKPEDHPFVLGHENDLEGAGNILAILREGAPDPVRATILEESRPGSARRRYVYRGVVRQENPEGIPPPGRDVH